MRRFIAVSALSAALIFSAFTSISSTPTISEDPVKTEVSESESPEESTQGLKLGFGPCNCNLTVSNFNPSTPVFYVARLNGSVVLSGNGTGSATVQLPRQQISQLSFSANTLNLPYPCPEAGITYSLNCGGGANQVVGTINPNGRFCNPHTSTWSVNSSCDLFRL